VLTNDPVSDTDARVVEVRIDLKSDQIESVARLSNARVEVTILLQVPESQSTDAFQGSLQTISHQSTR
jgi:HlyD family secretion protein